jgi:phospholipid/cholesterol/gamma-HCH transport system substrate-binding protein
VVEESSDKSGVGRTVARVAGLGALVVATVLVVMLLFGGDSGYRYSLQFESGGQLVPGNQVLVGGEPIGIVDDITLTDDAMAEVAISTDDPLHEGSTATIRSPSLSGVANRYVSVAPGPNSEPELEDGAVIGSDKTTSPVDLDQLFNTLDAPTREALRNVIKGQATIYTGNSAEARETYKYFAPGLQATERLLAELTNDQQALSQFLADGSTALGAIASRRDDLSQLTENANVALGAIAERNVEFDNVLAQLPPAMRQANTTFLNLRAALDDFDPLIADLGVVAPELPAFLRDLRSVVDPSLPVFRNLQQSISLEGANNDLNDSLRALPGAEAAASKSVGATIKGLDDAQETIDFAVPYTPDLLGFLTKFGQVTSYYNADGHYARVLPASSNLFDYNEATEVLEPIPPSEQFQPFTETGLGPFTRCPGGATQPNAGWPSPTDHPFLGGGSLEGDCDPGDVPPGP